MQGEVALDSEDADGSLPVVPYHLKSVSSARRSHQSSLQIDLSSGKSFRDRTPLLRPLRQLLKLGVVDSRHFSLCLEFDSGDRKAVPDLIKVNRGFGVYALGREARLREARRERHRKATRVRRRDQLFRVCSRATFHSRLERKRAVVSRPHLHVSLTFKKIAFPFRFCIAYRHFCLF